VVPQVCAFRRPGEAVQVAAVIARGDIEAGHRAAVSQRARLSSRCIRSGVRPEVVAGQIGHHRGTVLTWFNAGFRPAGYGVLRLIDGGAPGQPGTDQDLPTETQNRSQNSRWSASD
jgi:hypothetical protein